MDRLRFIYDAYKKIRNAVTKVLKIDMMNRNKTFLSVFDYDEIWKIIIKKKATDEKSCAGAFVDWDNTSRRGGSGRVVIGASPKKFKYYMSKQIRNVKENYKNDYIFIFAWNEWAESGYLEPDEKFGYGYLEALRDALIDNNEFKNN